MTRHLVVFARAPRLGRTKRRLAAGIGATEALRFYRLTLAGLLRRLGDDPRWTTWLCITPDGERDSPAFRRLPNRMPQGAGDLGARMTRPFHRLPPGPVVLVGSDIPGLEARHVWRAFGLLGTHELVFGPAADGGFWLVGARRRRALPPALFAGVRWSTPTVLADTMRGLPAGLACALADTLEDVDDLAGYRRFRASSAVRTSAKTGVQPPGPD